MTTAELVRTLLSKDPASGLLRGQALVPRLVADGRGSPVGTVAGVEPAGPVGPGSVVVLHVVPQQGPR